MNIIEIVKTFITAVQSGEMEMAANYMADDFVCSGWTHDLLDKGGSLALQSALQAAMPDYSFNLDDVQERDEHVEAFIRISGTQTNELRLPMFGLPQIEATGLAVTLPQVRAAFELADNQVVAMRIESVPGGGLSGLLQQVGAELPPSPYVRQLPDMGDTASSQEIREHNEIDLFGVHASPLDDTKGI